MSLSFQPPPDWLLKEYLDNKDRNPAVDTMNAILPAAQLYIQRKQQEESRQQAALGNYIKAFEAGGPVFAGDIAKRTGLQDPPALPSQSSPINPAEMQNVPVDENNIPITGPVQGPLNKIQGPEGYVPKGVGPNAIPAGQMQNEAKFRNPIIDHWNSSQSTASSPQESPESLLGLGAYGNKQLQARKLIKDLETDPHAPVPTLTTQQALDAGQVDPKAKILDTSKDDYYKGSAENLKALQEEREYKRKERRSTERNKIVDRFNSDASVKKSQQSIDAVNTIRGLLDSNNPIAAAAIPTYMARASGEVGNLSEPDKAPFGGSRAILERVQQAYEQAATGKLTQDNAKFIQDLTDVMEKRAKTNMEGLARKRAKQYSKSSDFLNEEDVFMSLSPDSEFVVNKSTPSATGFIKPGEEAEYEAYKRSLAGGR